MTRLLLEEGLPRSAVALLTGAGFATVPVADLGLATAEDTAILQSGRESDRTVVTLDADFHALLAMSAAIAPSVIRIRIEGLRGKELAELLLTVIAQCTADLERGAAVTVQSGRIRIRHLPLLDG